MKIQRILAATIDKGTSYEFQIVLSFYKGISGKSLTGSFIITDYTEKDGYFQEHLMVNFADAHSTFMDRVKKHGQAAIDSIEYCARQLGQAKITWEIL